MTDKVNPVSVAYYAEKKKEENYAFRRYLKTHANLEELDMQFAVLHEEFFYEYDCRYCRNCCEQYFEQPCKHFRPDGSCALGDEKPDDCKSYPYTNLPDRLSSMLNTIEIASVCPVVYQMLERLKELYRFDQVSGEEYTNLLTGFSEDEELIADAEMQYAKKTDPLWYFSMRIEQADGTAKNVDEMYVRIYDECWATVRKALRQDYPDKRPRPGKITSKENGYALFFGNIIQDMEKALAAQKEHDKRVAFCRDVIELFDLKEEGVGYMQKNFACAIGESLSDAGKIQESDDYYRKIIREFRESGYVVANYILTLLMRGEKKKAKELLEENIHPEMELSEDTEMLLERACEIYEEEGEKEKLELYEGLRKKYYSIRLSGRFIPKPIAKKKKVYPNDTCPCGSGKKYKKCCGGKG